MGIKKSAWIFACVLLWGIPTGLMAALFATVFFNMHSGDVPAFISGDIKRNLFIFLPVFTGCSVVLGVFMHQWAKRDQSK